MANFSLTRPDIPDSWKGGVSATRKILGGDKPISWMTLDKYAKLGKRYGGIDWRPGKRGRIFTGKEIKRFWDTL